MKKVFGLLCISALFTSLVSCADVDSRNNPTDPMADNYVADVLDKSSSSVVSGDSDIPNENAESSSSDDSGNGSNKDEQVSSSSVISNDGDSSVGSSSSADVNSSSSVTQNSSSSVVPSEGENSSGSEGSSSSVKTEGNSSSSVKTEDNSSSSVKIEDNSSSSVVPESSSSSEEITCGADKPNWVYLNSGSEYGCIQDSRDNQYYRTVKIGSQVWMAENLNYDYNEGTAKSYCYSNSSANCDKYGRLYVWSAAMDSAAVFSDAGKGCGYGTTCAAASTSSTTVVRGVCPDGWHLPSNSDWSTLWAAIGGTSTAGTKLKSTSDWDSSGNGEDAYGFSVLPAGFYDYNGSFNFAGSNGNFWSSTENFSSNAYGKNFGYLSSDVYETNYDKGVGFSVRCLRNSN